MRKIATVLVSLAAASRVFGLLFPEKSCKYFGSSERYASIFILPTTCPEWQLQLSPRTTEDSPWTHAPYCVQLPAAKYKQSQLCVFTDANFHFGQGISIITQPDIADKIVGDGLLASSPYAEAYTKGESKYEAIYVAGRGIGLFVKTFHEIEAGELLFVDYPTLLVPSELTDRPSQDVLYDLQWKAVFQLPDSARARTRGLAKSKGKYFDEIENVVGTNAFTQNKGGAVHDVMLTETAVSITQLMSAE
jgi:hypothetical protein